MTDEFEKWLEDEISTEFGGMDLSYGRKLGLQNALAKYRAFKAEQEPLAVLADRKGYNLETLHDIGLRVWRVILRGPTIRVS